MKSIFKILISEQIKGKFLLFLQVINGGLFLLGTLIAVSGTYLLMRYKSPRPLDYLRRPSEWVTYFQNTGHVSL